MRKQEVENEREKVVKGVVALETLLEAERTELKNATKSLE